MGKHYTIEFKLQTLQPILNGKMSIREAARFYNIPSNALVGTWLKRFEKSGINGLIPRKPSGRPPMKPKYAKMPPPPKTEEDRLRLRILQLEAEVAYLKELRRLRLQDEAEQQKLSKA
ncbi:helix-turn-helix domain-containing protein [Haemophilus haemolyticus]|uniref:Transposase n=1 Tax=Haemophilus haemolyticus M19501 TaxID=1028803 RepID=F9GQP6_HAEHA|nr:helix-turn-helix domain-containing protein [Haemophilus haemolyticus]EGT74399.1 transposase [Haemophilus haemolyticus M19501]EGT75417.1 transposase [Haemophilus haemolyticus M19501]